MKTFTKSVRFSVVSLAIWIALGVLKAVAQVEPPPNPNDLSDVVGVVLQKSTNYTVAVGGITELDEFNGIPLDLFVSGTIIDALEPVGAAPGISDRWIINPYHIRLVSDTNPTGLPPRPGAFQVPDEDFFPISMRFTSDADLSGQAFSDSLDIFIAGVLFTNITLVEGQTEGAGFFIPDLHFDLYEFGDVSDYVDIDPINGQIISDLDPSIIDTNVPPGFSHFEFVEDANGESFIDYDVLVSSDVIPEPSSLMLVGMGLAGLVMVNRRRRRTMA